MRHFWYRWWKTVTPYIFIAPVLILASTFYFVPIVQAIELSLHRWLIITGMPPEYIGLDNYRALLNDRYFTRAFWNTVHYVLGTVPIGLIISLGLALLLDTGVRFGPFFRTLFFIPVIIPMVVVAMIWRFLFSAHGGVINQLLRTFDFEPVRWLSDPNMAMNAVIVTSLWGGVGFNMVIFLAGLQGIPKVYYEAAQVEGANGFQRFWFITLPLLRPVVLFALVISTIASFQVFTQVFVMTAGGPAFSTTTLVYYIYAYAFEHFRMGYASAAAVLLFFGLLCLTAVQLWLLRSEHYK